jgi:GntR family transcriptional regulator
MIVRRDGIGYHELADVLRGRILAGDLRPGDRVPSETDLVQEYGCSRTTVRRAVQLLREEGLVLVRHGYATRVAQMPERTVVHLELGEDLVVRKATAADREALGLPLGGLAAEITTVDGTTHLYVADRHIFRPV